MTRRALKIAISGKSGCGNSTLTKLVSQTLDLPMVNYTFRNMAQEMNLPLPTLLAMAELDDQWDHALDAKQIALTEGGGCVLGSRLAIWLLKDADLKVFLTASPEVRAARIFQREGGDLGVVYQQTIERDHHDHDRYFRLYGIDNDHFEFADLVIDTTNRQSKLALEDIIYALRIKKMLV
jgi:cytidylate kinase